MLADHVLNVFHCDVGTNGVGGREAVLAADEGAALAADEGAALDEEEEPELMACTVDQTNGT